MSRSQITIRGTLVGSLWMPGCEAWKNLTYDVTREAKRMSGATLRDHVLNITGDGDFNGCNIADGVLTITTYSAGRSRSRDWPLDRFPSISDMVRTDWEGPCDFEDFDDLEDCAA